MDSNVCFKVEPEIDFVDVDQPFLSLGEQKRKVSNRELAVSKN